ncbi:MAG: hypothetical protein A2Y38_16410 [Spirochaetes bacterium GWB1_59_5]|nr:MAG: hypothetical protein A2Y38_16410 [Spirochaetes bacterium GWB1_59_5]
MAGLPLTPQDVQAVATAVQEKIAQVPQGIPTAWIYAAATTAVSVVGGLWALILTLRKEHLEAQKEKVALLEKLLLEREKRIEVQDTQLVKYAEAAANDEAAQTLVNQLNAIRQDLNAQFNARLQDMKDNTSLITGAVNSSTEGNRKIAELLSTLTTSLSSIHQDLRGIQTSESGMDQRLDLLIQKIGVVLDRLETVRRANS